MNKNDLRREFIWLLVIGILTFTIIEMIFGWGNWGIDIQLYDTYFILNVEQVFILIFLNVTFLIYLIKQTLNRFKIQSGNIILLLVTGFLIFITSLTIKFVGSMDQGWTIYPPLSALPEKMPQKYSITSHINSFIQGYEFIQIIILSFTAVMIGRAIEKKKFAA